MSRTDGFVATYGLQRCVYVVQQYFPCTAVMLRTVVFLRTVRRVRVLTFFCALNILLYRVTFLSVHSYACGTCLHYSETAKKSILPSLFERSKLDSFYMNNHMLRETFCSNLFHILVLHIKNIYICFMEFCDWSLQIIFAWLRHLLVGNRSTWRRRLFQIFKLIKTLQIQSKLNVQSS
jgi:hypothetical protein